jgi:hypothetical protein
MTKENKTQVLTKEELENLTSLQQQQNDLIFGLGQVEYQLGFLTQRKTLIKKELEAFENKQTEIAQEIEKKYGQGTVNLENGEIIKT